MDKQEPRRVIPCCGKNLVLYEDDSVTPLHPQKTQSRLQSETVQQCCEELGISQDKIHDFVQSLLSPARDYSLDGSHNN